MYTLRVIYFLNFPPFTFLNLHDYCFDVWLLYSYIFQRQNGDVCEGVSSNHPTTPIANLLLKTKQGLPFSLRIMSLASGWPIFLAIHLRLEDIQDVVLRQVHTITLRKNALREKALKNQKSQNGCFQK